MSADRTISNEEISEVLARIADLLEAKGGNIHRVRAYRNGAASVRDAPYSLADVIDEGEVEEIQKLPGVGEGLARLISNYVKTGRSNLLIRLTGEVKPEELFAQVPSIGEKLARRISEELDIRTLEELEQAAYDGRLQDIEGFGPERINTVQVSLAGMLSRGLQRRARQRVEGDDREEEDRPNVEILLKIDTEYRKKAEAGDLRKIAPKRFNPEGKAWLPIQHTERGEWNLTVLFSNTARAHELGMTQDWVVIYYSRDDREEGQATIVTKRVGPMEGKRVVRGRETECLQYYRSKEKEID